MYLDYYGLKLEPFSITPDPKFLYFTRRHREALDHIYYGIQGRKGFIQITGEIGSGKTTLCRALLEKLDPPRYQTALILNPCLNETQLLRSILTELHLPASPDEDRVALLEKLNRFLIEQARQDNDVILIIDEAQNMSLDLLEQLRMLSNLETDHQKLLQILLVGQPELRQKLDDPRLCQLRQRILVRYHLTTLNFEEMGEYIQHRLRLGGAARRLQFDRAALRAIFRYTRGTPRLINAVCDKTLLMGYVNQTDRFKGAAVRLAIRELEGRAS